MTKGYTDFSNDAGTGTVGADGFVLASGAAVLSKLAVYTQTITPAQVAQATVAEQTFTVTGLTTADKVVVNPGVISNAVGVGGWRVSAADTLAVQFINPTAGALTPTAGTWTILALRVA